MYYKDFITELPAYKPAKLIRQPSAGLVKLSSNENPLGPSPLALAAMQDALAGVHRYPDSGAWGLKQKLAEHYGLEREMVTCSNGSDELVFLLCLAFLREGDEVVMAEGTFISYLLRTLEMGGQAVQVPLRNYTHDLEAMAAAITPRTRLLFLCNPNNPTGTTNTAAEVAQLLKQVPEEVLIVADEAYIEFVEHTAEYPDLLSELRRGRPNLILLRTFAKIYGLAGLRLGYAFGPVELITYLERSRPTFNVNTLAQTAGIAALDDTAHLERSREYSRRSRIWLSQELEALGLEVVPGDTNFLAVKVRDDVALAAELLEKGFMIMSLTGWGLPGLIRISFGMEDEHTRFIEALSSILKPLSCR
ncbi:MAG: histidinol-phosphate transaminase [Chloroflexota bacterium]|nr:histidinol-phosphate transaminase [Chloroflexota bacterium]